MTPNDRFLRNMMVVIALAGLVWLGFALSNVWRGGAFHWSGLGVFVLLIVALGLGRTRSRAKH